MDKMIHEDLKRASLDKVKQLMQENNGEITGNTLEAIGDLVDIYKDIANVEYWCEKEDSEEILMEEILMETTIECMVEILMVVGNAIVVEDIEDMTIWMKCTMSIQNIWKGVLDTELMKILKKV